MLNVTKSWIKNKKYTKQLAPELGYSQNIHLCLLFQLHKFSSVSIGQSTTEHLSRRNFSDQSPWVTAAVSSVRRGTDGTRDSGNWRELEIVTVVSSSQLIRDWSKQSCCETFKLPRASFVVRLWFKSKFVIILSLCLYSVDIQFCRWLVSSHKQLSLSLFGRTKQTISLRS